MNERKINILAAIIGFILGFIFLSLPDEKYDQNKNRPRLSEEQLLNAVALMDNALTLMSKIIYTDNPENRTTVTIYVVGIGTISGEVDKSYIIQPNGRNDYDEDFDITALERLGRYTNQEIASSGAIIIQSDTPKEGTWVRFAEYGTVWFPYNLTPTEVELYKIW